jgi:hypothetical protein
MFGRAFKDVKLFGPGNERLRKGGRNQEMSLRQRKMWVRLVEIKWAQKEHESVPEAAGS